MALIARTPYTYGFCILSFWMPSTRTVISLRRRPTSGVSPPLTTRHPRFVESLTAISYNSVLIFYQATRFLARVSKGVYSQPDLESDEFADVQAEILQNYYGVSGRRRNRKPGQRAGDSDNELEADDGQVPDAAGSEPIEDADEDVPLPEERWEEVADEAAAFLGLSEEDAASFTDAAQRIAADQGHNVRHDPVEVVHDSCPFDVGQELEFWETVSRMEDENIIPEGLLMTDIEWAERAENGEDESEYPTSEDIPVGRLRQLQRIPLPIPIWGARALKWCRALSALNQCLLDD